MILYYINVFMSPFTLSLHLFFDWPLFLRRAVDCHYKTRQTAARQTDTRQTGKTRQTVARQTGIASKWDAPNWTASKRTRQTGLTANRGPMWDKYYQSFQRPFMPCVILPSMLSFPMIFQCNGLPLDDSTCPSTIHKLCLEVTKQC